MHQEIMSHQQLVESVCDKAQQLVDQTQDKSLNVYLQSIKQLFHNIVVKSQVCFKKGSNFCDQFLLILVFLNIYGNVYFNKLLSS